MPRGGEGPGFGLAIPDDAGNQQAGVVEGGAESVRQRISELAAFVDRAGYIRRAVAGNPTGKRELPEQALQARLVLPDVRIHLGVAALQVGVGYQGGPAMPGTDDCEYVAVAGDNDSIQMRVDEIDAGSCSPVSQQSRLHVLERQRLAQQRVVEQIDLAC